MAIIRDGEKFACESCVKGHRVTRCKHEDRPLLPIGKKGRPFKQCLRCRELRRTRNRHAKCTCDSQEDEGTFTSEEQTSSHENVVTEQSRTEAQTGTYRNVAQGQASTNKETTNQQTIAAKQAEASKHDFNSGQRDLQDPSHASVVAEEISQLANAGYIQECFSGQTLQNLEPFFNDVYSFEDLEDENILNFGYDDSLGDGNPTF